MNLERNKRITTIKTILLLSMSLGLTGCSHAVTTAVLHQTDTNAKPVVAAPVQIKKLATVSELSGTLEPMEETTLSFEVAGEIQSMKGKEGDTVAAGEVLAQLNSTDYSLQVALAGADVSRASAALAKVRNGSREQEKLQAKAALDAKKISWEKTIKDYQRMEQLFKKGAISQVEHEHAKNALELSQKDYDATKQSYLLVVEGARAEDIASTQASYQTAVVSQSQAAHTLAKTQLKTPISGTILSKMADVGQLANAGTPVYRIGHISQLKTVLPVPDKEIAAWHAGDIVELSLYGQKRTGKVTKIYPATNQQTGTIGVEVAVDNRQQNWFAGQVVSAKRTLSQKEGIFVPTEAVMSRGSEPFVFLLKENKAVKTPVALGTFLESQMEITRGLQPGDIFIAKGGDRLLDGDFVTVEGGK